MLIRREARLSTLELERARRGAGEVERGLGPAASPERVERPDHAGRPDVEVLQRERLLPPIPFVRGPERIGVERGGGIRDDRGDGVFDPRRIPRLVDQRLELRGFVEDRPSVHVRAAAAHDGK